MDGSPAAASAPAAVEDCGVDPRIDANRVPAGRNGPTGRPPGPEAGAARFAAPRSPPRESQGRSGTRPRGVEHRWPVCRRGLSSRSPGSPPASFPCGRLLAQTGDPAGGERRPAPHADRVGLAFPLSPPFASKPKQAAGAVGLEVPDGWLAASGGPSVRRRGRATVRRPCVLRLGSRAEGHRGGSVGHPGRGAGRVVSEEDCCAWRRPSRLEWDNARRVRPRSMGAVTPSRHGCADRSDELIRFAFEIEPLLEQH